MQYLIKTTTHDTGEVFHDVIKAKENEVFTLVDAKSKEEAERTVKEPRMLANRGLGTTIKHERFTEEEKEILFGKEQTKKCFKNKQRQSHDNALKWLDKSQERQSDAWVSFKERKINMLPSLYCNMIMQPEDDYHRKLFNRMLAECREMDKLDGKNDVYKTMKGIL